MQACTKKRLSPASHTSYNPIGFDPAEVLPVHLRRYADQETSFHPSVLRQELLRRQVDQVVRAGVSFRLGDDPSHQEARLPPPLPPHAQAGVGGRDQLGGSTVCPGRDLGRDDP